nr:uncharacterized protein LOC109751626 isoform X1 [Aegilops tauschii subsp. strangulata]
MWRRPCRRRRAPPDAPIRPAEQCSAPPPPTPSCQPLRSSAPPAPTALPAVLRRPRRAHPAGCCCPLSAASMDTSDESSDGSDEECDLGMFACAMEVASPSERLLYAPRKSHRVTGLQWVAEKEQDAKAFYSMFRMRRSVFYSLHELLVEKYELKSTCNISSKEALAQFLWTLGRCQTTDNVADRFGHSRSVINKKIHEVLECVDRMAGDFIRPHYKKKTHL